MNRDYAHILGLIYWKVEAGKFIGVQSARNIETVVSAHFLPRYVNLTYSLLL